MPARRPLLRALAGAAALALFAGGAVAQDLKFPVGEGAFNWDSYKAYDEATNLDGQTIKMFGPWRGEDQVLVETMLAYFTAASGVKVEYSSSENYEQQIVIDTQAGSPPNIAILPQPGLIADLASKGQVTPLGDETKAGNLLYILSPDGQRVHVVNLSLARSLALHTGRNFLGEKFKQKIGHSMVFQK